MTNLTQIDYVWALHDFLSPTYELLSFEDVQLDIKVPATPGLAAISLFTMYLESFPV